MTKVNWAQVRAAYEENAEPVLKVAERFSITGTSLYKRIELEGWNMRRRRKPARQNKATLVRLWRIVTREIDLLEQDMRTDSSILPLAERGRLMKAMTGLLKLMAAIADLEQRFKKISEQVDGEAKTSSGDDDAMRESIAQRIDGLREHQSARDGAEGVEKPGA